MEKQQTFDTVVAHLRQQGKKAMAADGLRCLYRAPDGSKCAAGCLIPDELYWEEMEGTDIWRAVGVLEILQKEGHDLDLVGDLQVIHDEYAVEMWEQRFKGLAECHVLIYTPPV